MELGILEQTGGGDRVTYRYLALICANLSNRKVEGNLPGMPAGCGAGASGPDESGGREADGEEKGKRTFLRLTGGPRTPPAGPRPPVAVEPGQRDRRDAFGRSLPARVPLIAPELSSSRRISSSSSAMAFSSFSLLAAAPRGGSAWPLLPHGRNPQGRRPGTNTMGTGGWGWRENPRGYRFRNGLQSLF